MTTEELEQIAKLLEPLRQQLYEQGANIVRLVQGQKRLETDLAQTKTTVASIKTVVETTEETVNTMDEGLKEVVKNHRERIERLEEQTRSTTHKN